MSFPLVLVFGYNCWSPVRPLEHIDPTLVSTESRCDGDELHEHGFLSTRTLAWWYSYFKVDHDRGAD